MRYCYKSTNGTGFMNLKTPIENIDGYTAITEEEFNQLIAEKRHAKTGEQLAKEEIQNEIALYKDRLRELDYIGIKIATGRATVEEYAEQIAEMNRLADRINELESEIG